MSVRRRRALGPSRRIPRLGWALMTISFLVWSASAARRNNGLTLDHIVGRKDPVSTTAAAAPDDGVLHWEIHPTAAIAEERRYQRRRRRLHGRTNETAEDFTPPGHWFHPKQSAVYATLADAADPAWQEDSDPQWHDFHSHRHLSRYERLYRSQSGLDLQLGWNGTYFPNFNHSVVNGTNSNDTSSRRHLRIGEQSQSDFQHLAGGQFNNYQAAPLSQGYGTHFANVWVGSPTPQRKTVIVDTGSHYTAFPCTGCRHCGALHHTDPYFAPEKSRTFHKLQCDECKDGVVCDNGRCKFQQHYTEGSSWEAIQVQDRFYVGGSDILDSVNPGDEKYVIDYMFGCTTSMTGLFVTQLADGIMGMSAHQATLPKHLYDKGLLEHNMFAMCYRRELGTSKRGVTAGSLTLGGVSRTLDTSPMVYAKNMKRSGWYTVYVKNIFIRSGGGQSAQSTDPKHKTIKVRLDPVKLNSGKGVIVDSGTTDTYLNKQVLKEFTKAWKKATGRAYSNAAISLTDAQLRRLPTILVQCQADTKTPDPSIESYDSISGYAGVLDPSAPNDLLIAVPATSYMDWSPVTKLYASRVYFTESVGGVLGANTMQGHNVLFDWENGRIGFAESSCTYDKKDVPTATEDEGFATDCDIGSPILSQSCIDSVDQSMCENNPTNIALLGMERWTAVVESPGNDAGLTCVEATKDAILKNPWDVPVIKCEGGGFCEESRPCQLTCSETREASKVVPLSTVHKDRKKCSETVWSACDYGCRQVRVESVAYSDGICHEKSRESRPCHVGACGRSDPCRIPFLVHAVFALYGASVQQWSLQAEDLFSLALNNAAQSLSPLSGPTFEAGDVNVLLALPWYTDDDEYPANPRVDTSDSSIQGIKVVLEISVFNALVGKNGTSDSSNDSGSDGPLQGLLRNTTSSFFSSRQEKTKCSPDQLHVSAEKALALNKVLRSDSMLRFLVKEIKNLDGLNSTLMNSPFEPLIKSDPRGTESRLLSSWTVRTGVSDEAINYFGPPRPLWYQVIRGLHLVLMTMLAFVFASSLYWCLSLGFEDLQNGRFSMPFTRGRQRYVSLSRADEESGDGDSLEDDIMGGDVELTSHHSSSFRRHGLSPLKRRTTSMSDR